MAGPHPTGSTTAARRDPSLRDEAERGRGPGAQRRLWNAWLVGATLLVTSLLIFSVPLWTAPARANTNCPSSTNSFGTQSIVGDCTVTASTGWGNGTLTLAGNLIINSGARLTLWNMNLQMNPGSDQQYQVAVAGGQLVVRGGTITSANPSYGWRLVTNTASTSLVDIRATNVSYAGSGSYPGILLQGGNGHRLEHLTVTRSGLGGTYGVIVVNGGSISDVKVDNSSFSGTGTAFDVEYAAAGANLVFRDNTVTNFAAANGGPAVHAGETQIASNTISVGSATGIEVWGGGPGWPSTNAYAASGNTITTMGNAIATIGSRGYDVLSNKIFNGHVHLDGTGNRFAYNNVSGTDERVTPGQHVLWTSPNSSVDHNTFWNVGLTQDSVILTYENYGNIKVTDNRLYLGCYSNNCMAIETINVQAAQTTIFPGFPTVEIARNHITWTAIPSGSVAIGLDNEFSEREWLHNNVFDISDPNGVANNALQGGGVTNSVYENNTDYGPTTFCIYEYIYSDAGNTFQNNRCDRATYGGIFQTGGNVYRNNVFTNITNTGIFICPNGPCAGSNANTTNNAWYNNVFTFATGSPAYLARMDLGNALYNNFIGHGSTHWVDTSGVSHLVYGDWLFFANAPISHLAFTDGAGTRTLMMTVGGQSYSDRESVAGINDQASLAVDGSIDYWGSLNGETVLKSLSPGGTTSVTVTGTGTMTFTLSHFWPSTQYAINLDNLGTGVITTLTSLLDSTGWGQFTVPFGVTETQFTISFAPVSGSPPPASTPPAVTTNAASSVGTSGATLNGNLGALGSASSVTVGFRYGTSSTLAGATNVTVGTESSATPFTDAIAGLTASTTYYVAAWANGQGFTSGSILSFTTSANPPPAPVAPTVTTGSASSVGSTTATLYGAVTNLGTASTVTVGFRYGTSAALSGASNVTVGTESATASFTDAVSGLAAGMTYYASAWANGQGFASGSIVSFVTLASSPPPSAPPSVTTNAATSVTSSTATVNGYLGSLGTAASVTVGFWYGTSSSLAGATNATAATLSGAAAFSLSVSGWKAGTTYYFRSWASGTGFATGSILSVTTLAATASPQTASPTVSTSAPSKVAGTWATLGGNLVSMGSASAVVVGFYVSTSPSMAGAVNVSAATLATPSSFTVTVSGLTSKTTYYVIAWASGKGFALGNVVSFTATASKRPGPTTLLSAPKTQSAFTAALVGAVSLWWPGILALGMAALIVGILLPPPKSRDPDSVPAAILRPHSEGTARPPHSPARSNRGPR